MRLPAHRAKRSTRLIGKARERLLTSQNGHDIEYARRCGFACQCRTQRLGDLAELDPFRLGELAHDLVKWRPASQASVAGMAGINRPRPLARVVGQQSSGLVFSGSGRDW